VVVELSAIWVNSVVLALFAKIGSVVRPVSCPSVTSDPDALLLLYTLSISVAMCFKTSGLIVEVSLRQIIL
jgi:hypothetical protein